MTGNYITDCNYFSEKLNLKKNFDIVRRDFWVADRTASLFFIDGFMKDDIFQRLLTFLYRTSPEELKRVKNMREFSFIRMPYVEVAFSSDDQNIISQLLSGQAVIIIDGFADAMLVDTRTYPVRSIDEPEKDRSLRGSRDGFVETFIFNTAMIRRRIRDTALHMEYYQVGDSSKVDVAISYMVDRADMKLVEKLREKLKTVKLSGISMTSQALSEVLIPTCFFNPFPKVRFTERPDFASACLLEGKVLLIMDNSPSVMVFPNSFADFQKETDDYYFPPLTGTYVRIIRNLVSILTVVMTPFILVLLNNPHWIPHWLGFINTTEDYSIPFFYQFLLLELVIDGLRLASLNTPNTLSGSLGIIGGLILSEFAVNAGWFVSETIIYMAFVAIASYAQPSFEMGYALKFSRIFILLLSQFFNFYGFFAGVVLVITVAACSKTLSGRGYLYPVIPFNLSDFKRLFVRTTLKNGKGH